MAGYHKYVFDTSARVLVGDFDTMYQQESLEGYDSWHQEDSRWLQRKICLEIIGAYNFDSIVDIGCAKGSFTHILKKRNNKVVGVDISETALAQARSRYPDIQFIQADAAEVGVIWNLYDSFQPKGGADLTVCTEILSYVEKWRDLIKVVSQRSKFFLVCLDIPQNPIGFVKSSEELVAEVERHFDLIEVIQMKISGFSIVFGSSLNREL